MLSVGEVLVRMALEETGGALCVINTCTLAEILAGRKSTPLIGGGSRQASGVEP